MTQGDVIMFWVYFISACAGVALGIIEMYKAKTKEQFANALFFTLVCLTPGVVLLSIILIMAGVVLLYNKVMNIFYKE